MHLVFDHARHWVRKNGLVLHIWVVATFLHDSAYCSQRQELAKVEHRKCPKKQNKNQIDVQSILMHFIPLILYYFFFFVRLNHSANCQSAGSEIDPISLIFAEGYLSCAPGEVPPPGFACFKHSKSQIMQKKKKRNIPQYTEILANAYRMS